MDNEVPHIQVTHVTIRQSIFFLLLKLIVVEFIAAAGVIVFRSLLQSSIVGESIARDLIVFNMPFYLILVVLKTGLTFFVIFRWLEEYYEITPTEIIHRTGFIFKNVDINSLEHLSTLEIDQGLFGRIFNYGSLTLFNFTLKKDVKVYLIHNPLKYHTILKGLMPGVDKERHMIREHVLKNERL